MRKFIATLFLFLLSGTAQAGPLHSIKHNLARNWQVYTADGIDITANVYDAHSSGFCQPNCVEESPLLGPHPSTGQFLTVGLSTALVQITFNHLIWHFAPTHADRDVFLWVPTAGVAAQKAWAIKSNYELRP